MVSVKVPVPLLTKLAPPLMTPLIWLAALEELIVKAVIFDTAPPIVAAPLPELMVKADPAPLLELTPPATLTGPFALLKVFAVPVKVRLAL